MNLWHMPELLATALIYALVGTELVGSAMSDGFASIALYKGR